MIKYDYSSYTRLLEEIRETIKDRKLTQQAIADEIGVRRDHLNKMLNDKKRIDGAVLFYLIKRLEIEDRL